MTKPVPAAVAFAQVVGAGAQSGALDAGNILKPMLGRGELRCLGATTLDEYRQYLVSRYDRESVTPKRELT